MRNHQKLLFLLVILTVDQNVAQNCRAEVVLIVEQEVAGQSRLCFGEPRHCRLLEVK